MRVVTKKQAVKLIKALEGPHLHFTAEAVGEDVIGYIDDNERHIEVHYLEDNLGQYISMVLPMKRADRDEEEVSCYLKRWIVNGRFELTDDSIVLSTIFPILDPAFLDKQMHHALVELWDMSNIVRNTREIYGKDGKNR